MIDADIRRSAVSLAADFTLHRTGRLNYEIGFLSLSLYFTDTYKNYFFGLRLNLIEHTVSIIQTISSASVCTLYSTLRLNYKNRFFSLILYLTEHTVSRLKRLFLQLQLVPHREHGVSVIKTVASASARTLQKARCLNYKTVSSASACTTQRTLCLSNKNYFFSLSLHLTEDTVSQ